MPKKKDTFQAELWDSELCKCYGELTLAVEPSGGFPEVIRWRGQTFVTNDKLWGGEKIVYFEVVAREIGAHDLVQP